MKKENQKKIYEPGNVKSKLRSTLKCCFICILLQLGIITLIYCQARKSIFKSYIDKEAPNTKYGEIVLVGDGGVLTGNGGVLVSASEFSFALITGGNIGAFTFGLDNQDYGIKNLKSVFTGNPIKTITESPERNIFFFCDCRKSNYLF